MKKLYHFFCAFTNFSTILISMVLSYLFYSSLTNVFFYSVIYGSLSVLFDGVKVILLNSNMQLKRFLAYFFVLFSVIASVSISLADIESSSLTKVDDTYIQQLNSNIEMLNKQIETQGKRIENTSANYGTASKKESEVYFELVKQRDMYMKDLASYKVETKSSEKIASFETLANLTGIDIRTIMLFLFFFRAVLLEVAIIIMSVKPKSKIDTDIPMLDDCKKLLAKWTNTAKKTNNEKLNRQFDIVNKVFETLEKKATLNRISKTDDGNK